ncbi:molybdopterin-dependent oxidoreductase [Ammoniphilus resinae]|uniref:DMSO/TMAO reductase YedYZ molybdopterin-dependent catalytic subunit n=1 Tax=Ammoniphilus resinae TaxID=861532 RepID=A0ABS4GQU9_9BACL|nr:molybdopterin-dependent oxidoreductase [Ammoniphilus resinae]MBP1932651.1 DMSO/TMAO reductase YedYZ molybdopterin-dependent catalytic subunit [Ammoniphilus resinae]
MSFKKVKMIHHLHVLFVCLLLFTGILLYFAGIPWISKMLMRNIHLGIAVGYIVLLLYSLLPVYQYKKKLGKSAGKQWHILFIYLFSLLWLLSGFILWINHPAILDYRIIALQLHDWISVVIIPWVLIHVYWKKRGVPFIGRHRIKGIEQALSERLLTRREWLVLATGTGLSMVIAASLKWFKPFLEPWETVRAVGMARKGYFRIYTVTSKNPSFDPKSWKLTLDGLVDSPQQFYYSDLTAMEWRTITRDFHCVTGWSVFNVTWSGIPFVSLINIAQPKQEGRFVKIYSADGVYTETYTIEQLANQDVLLAFQLDDQPLIQSQGAPCRLIHPKMYGYKSIKWVNRIEITSERGKGYWEALENYDLDGYI